MDVWTVRAEAERQQALDGIPIVVTSGVDDVRREVESLQADAVPSKPFELDEAFRVIRDLVKPHSEPCKPRSPSFSW